MQLMAGHVINKTVLRAPGAGINNTVQVIQYRWGMLNQISITVGKHSGMVFVECYIGGSMGDVLQFHTHD